MPLHNLPVQLTSFVGREREIAQVKGFLSTARLLTVTGTSGLDVVRLNPGESARVEFRPHRKGRFVFACTIEGHKEAGMLGSIEVR